MRTRQHPATVQARGVAPHGGRTAASGRSRQRVGGPLATNVEHRRRASYRCAQVAETARFPVVAELVPEQYILLRPATAGECSRGCWKPGPRTAPGVTTPPTQLLVKSALSKGYCWDATCTVTCAPTQRVTFSPPTLHRLICNYARRPHFDCIRRSQQSNYAEQSESRAGHFVAGLPIDLRRAESTSLTPSC